MIHVILSLMSEIQVGTCLLAPLEEMLLAEAGWRRAMQVFKIFFVFEDFFIITYFLNRLLLYSAPSA